MIEAFQYINKAFESKVRLGIMAILMVNEEADFNFLKEQLSLFFRQPRKVEKLSNRILKP